MNQTTLLIIGIIIGVSIAITGFYLVTRPIPNYIAPEPVPHFPIYFSVSSARYEIASLANIGCADTVYNITNGQTYEPMNAIESFSIIYSYDQQVITSNPNAPYNQTVVACQSLADEVNVK